MKISLPWIKAKLPWMLLILSITLNMFFLGGFLYSRNRHLSFSMSKGSMRWMHRLDRPHRKDLRQRHRMMRDQFHNLHRAHLRSILSHREELVRDTPDEERLELLIEQLDQNQRRFHRDTLESALGFLRTLPPEQRRAIFQGLAQFGSQMERD